MSGNTSSVPAAVESMLAHLVTVAGASGLPDVAVYDGAPTEYTSNYSLQVTGWSNHQQRWADASGYFSRWEEYDLDLLIHVWQGDVDADTRRNEAFALLELIVQQLLADKNAGGALTMSGDWSITAAEAVQGPADGVAGWGVDMTVTVHCQNILLTV